MIDRLSNMTHEELLNEFNQNMDEAKHFHDMAVQLGKLGVSPHYLNMYYDSVQKIKKYEEQQ